MKGKILLKQLCAVCTVLFCIVATGCRDDVKNIYKGEPEEPEEVPNDFDFSTKKDLQIKIHYDVQQGYKVHFEAYTQNPISLNDEKGFDKTDKMEPFIEGWTDGNGDFTCTTCVANMVKEVYVYSSDEGVPMLMKSEVAENAAFLTSKSSVVSDFSSRASRAVSKAIYTDWPKQSFKWTQIGEWDINGTPGYLINDATLRYEPTVAFNNIVNATHPDNTDLATFFMCTSISIQEEANVYLNYISHNNSERNNTLAYYTYNGSVPTKAEINSKLVIAYPNTRADGLKTGDVIQLYYNDNGNLEPNFPAGAKIGFVLLIDAFNNGTVDKVGNIMYSQNNYNRWDFSDVSTASKPGLISYVADNQYVLAFEDQPWDEQKGRGAIPDFHDDVFVIASNPITSIPTPEPGVDPELPAYNMILKSTGILGFEDNWPEAGDYDLNDVMVSYVRSFYADEFYRTLALDEKYTFINNGATYSNGFGYIIDSNLSVDMIESCEVISSYSCTGQGIDHDISTPATIMLFDNSRNVPINTSFEVRTVLKKPVGLISYNPFITVNEKTQWMDNGRIEVHLSKYAPTSKGNNELWGTGSDMSGGENYYVREGNYPFAIDLMDPYTNNPPLPDFRVPIETKAVDATYPAFKNWVESKGTQEKQWYLYPIEN